MALVAAAAWRSSPAAPRSPATIELPGGALILRGGPPLRLAFARHEGEPHSIPTDGPPEPRPGFAEGLRPLANADDELELYGTDCTEFSCIEGVETEGDTDADW